MNPAAANHYDFALGEIESGRLAEAVEALRKALALDPTLVRAHHDLGVALEALGRLDDAEVAYREAIRVDPLYTAAHGSLAELLQGRGRLEESRGCLERMLSIKGSPAVYMRLGTLLWRLADSTGARDAFQQAVEGGERSAEAYYNLGSAQLECRGFDEAIQSAREALQRRPGFAEAEMLQAAAVAASGSLEVACELLQQPSEAEGYLALAIRLLNSRLFEPAQRCLERVLQEYPGSVMARHLLTALSGENPERPVEGYVRRVFDASAATFDREVTGKLGYAIPQEMVAVLRGLMAQPADILDLGCGTGLVGAALCAYSRKLVGVDLAPNMIKLARSRGVYTELRCTDLVMALAHDEKYDVVTAADVFIYVGKLDAVIPAIRAVLRPGGLFAFSVEAIDGEDYRLGVMGRYAHSVAYLQRLADESRFETKLLRRTRIRLEHRRPLQGWLSVWQAKSS